GHRPHAGLVPVSPTDDRDLSGTGIVRRVLAGLLMLVLPGLIALAVPVAATPVEPAPRAVVGPGIEAAVAAADHAARGLGTAAGGEGGPIVVAALRDPLTRSARLDALEASTRAVQS